MKTNPYRDIESKAYNRGRKDGIKTRSDVFMALTLLYLADKVGLTEEQLHDYVEHMNGYADGINQDELDFNEIKETLEKEYNIIIN